MADGSPELKRALDALSSLPSKMKCSENQIWDRLTPEPEGGWTADWPQEPGAYWFYGLSGWAGDTEPRLLLAVCLRSLSGRPPCYVPHENRFVSITGEGVWLRIPEPVLPLPEPTDA